MFNARVLWMIWSKILIGKFIYKKCVQDKQKNGMVQTAMTSRRKLNKTK